MKNPREAAAHSRCLRDGANNVKAPHHLPVLPLSDAQMEAVLQTSARDEHSAAWRSAEAAEPRGAHPEPLRSWQFPAERLQLGALPGLRSLRAAAEGLGKAGELWPALSRGMARASLTPAQN